MSPLFYVIGGGRGGDDVVRDCNPIPDGLLDEFDLQVIFSFFYVHFCEILAFATCLKRTFHKVHELLILQNILPSNSEENDARNYH